MWWQTVLETLKTHSWMVELFFITLGTLIVSYVTTRVYKRLYPRLQRSRTIWDDTLLHALYMPFKFGIWGIGLSLTLHLIGVQGGNELILNSVPILRSAAIIGLFGWFLFRFISEAERRFGKRVDNLDPTTLQAVCQILRVSVVITTALIALQTFGVSISGVIAFGGVGALAVGMAAKDMLANFFGGLMIFLDRPFKVGDWICSPDKEIEGTVEHIGWRLTRIRSFAKRPLYVPNGIFSTITLENPSRMTNRRIYTNVGLRYEDASKMAVILADVEKMLQEHPEIDTTNTLMVHLVEFGPSSLNFMVYTFTKTTNWELFQAIQQDVFLKIIAIIEGHGAQCAFPTTTLHVPEGIKLQQASQISLSATLPTKN